MTIRFWLTHPREALCDAGIKGCELHIRTGYFPWWNRKEDQSEWTGEKDR